MSILGIGSDILNLIAFCNVQNLKRIFFLCKWMFSRFKNCSPSPAKKSSSAACKRPTVRKSLLVLVVL